MDFNLEQVISLAEDAGKIALGHFGKVEPLVKDDRTLVTHADLEIEKALRDGLAEITPGYGILGEEGGLRSAEDRDAPYWVLDPLDGTSAFISGLPVWAVSIGLVRGGKAAFGLVFLPLIGEMVYTGENGMVFRNRKPCPPARSGELDSESVLYVPTNLHRKFRITFPGKLRSLGSAAYHGILTARPLTAGVLYGSIYLWDAVAVLAINEAWGMRAAALDGRDIPLSAWTDYRLPEPLLLAAPRHFEQLSSSIQPL